MAHAYPVHLSLSGHSVLAVGAGAVAHRRLPRLLEAGAAVRVVAPHADPRIEAWAREGAIHYEARAFEDTDLDGAQLVFIATNDAAINAHVAARARAVGVWVNRADAPDDSDFVVPAVAHSEHLAVSVSCEMRAPTAARRLAHELAQWLRTGPDRFVAVVSEARSRLRDAEPASARAKLRALAEGSLWDACRNADEAAIAAAVAAVHRGTAP